MIPKTIIEKILNAAHIEDVVGEFLTLQKRGTVYRALCPFHQEKTPSFTSVKRHNITEISTSTRRRLRRSPLRPFGTCSTASAATREAT